MAKTATSRSAKSGTFGRSSKDAKTGRMVVRRNSETGAFISTSAAKTFSVTTDGKGTTVVKLK